MSAPDTHPWWRESEPEAVWPMYEDFVVFMCLVWEFLGLPRPTPVQRDIAHYLQHGPRRSVIEAFRGVGKSWITAAFVCWLLLRDAQLNIMVVSASKDRADNFTTFTLRLIREMPELQHLAPRADQRESVVQFDVAPAEPDQAPSVRSVGVFGQMTGGRADVIIPDDTEVPNTSETAGMRSKLATRVSEFEAILKPGGGIHFLGTPQTEESLYNALPEKGYSIRVWPARFPTAKQVSAYGDRLAPMLADALRQNPTLAGRPTDPRRFTEQELAEREASYGRSGFQMQFMLDTTLADADRYPLKLRDLIVMDVNPEVAPEKVIWAADPDLIVRDLTCVGFSSDRYYRPMEYLRDSHGNISMREFTGSVMFVDPAGRGADECSYAVAKMLNSTVFAVDSGAVAGYDEASLEALAAVAKKNAVKLIRIESNFGDGMFEALLKPVLAKAGYPCKVEGVRSVGQKEKRIIDTLEPVMSSHRLVVDRKLIERDLKSTLHYPAEKQNTYRLMYQLSRITRDRGSLAHDDRVEALAGAVAIFTEQMAADRDKLIAEAHDAALDAEVKRFMEHALGNRNTRQEATWCSGWKAR